jgi:erythromycin esterase-like protein
VFRGGVETWNLRDRHMAETLEELTSHLERTQGPTKIAVWAHNSHVGDARATDMGARGELNIGQLVRERHPGQAAIVGLTTFTGTVTAASDWGSPAERKWVRPAGPGSWEELLHELGAPKLVFEPAGLRFAQEGNPRSRGFRSGATQTPIWGERRLERAIGVVYRPETERVSHYFGARLADQFDFVVHLDETHAVEPLERTTAWEEGELPETYPWAV